MNVLDRITLLKAGYKKDEIEKMIEEDKTAEATPEAEVSPHQDKLVEAMSVLASKVKGLEETIQASNINESEMKISSQDEVIDILSGLINPVKKEENK